MNLFPNAKELAHCSNKNIIHPLSMLGDAAIEFRLLNQRNNLFACSPLIFRGGIHECFLECQDTFRIETTHLPRNYQDESSFMDIELFIGGGVSLFVECGAIRALCVIRDKC